MKKTLIAATSAFALVLGLSGAALANSDRPTFDHSNQLAVAVSVQVLGQSVANNFTGANDHSSSNILTDHSMNDGQANGSHTFTHQVLNVNNLSQGVNNVSQGAISIAVAANIQGN